MVTNREHILNMTVREYLNTFCQTNGYDLEQLCCDTISGSAIQNIYDATCYKPYTTVSSLKKWLDSEYKGRANENNSRC